MNPKLSNPRPSGKQKCNQKIAAPQPIKIGYVLLIVLAGILVYYNSFNAPFIFDDHDQILQNERIQRLSLADIFRDTNRPIVDLSFAINYALGQKEVWGYHVVNLGIHILAALVLIGIIRRTLWLPRFRQRYGQDAQTIGLFAALIWLVHPLQTESVTYITQRAESMMGLFYFLTLYCIIRHVENRQRKWGIAAVIACALGMGTKEVMVTAPLCIWFYEKIVAGNSFLKIYRERGWVYLGLVSTWILLVHWEMAPRYDIPTAGFGVKGMTPWQYALTQPGVILHYLKLAVWPDPLCLDYGWPLAETWPAIVIPFFIIGIFILATFWAVKRQGPLAFAGIWFFLILSPSSSFIPIKDAAFEHRMYLSSAGVVALMIFAGEFLLTRWAASKSILITTMIAVAGIFGWLTLERNKIYATEISVWQDVIGKRPDNARAQFNLGLALLLQKENDAALRRFKEAVRLKPDYSEGYYNIGLILIRQNRFKEAMAPLQKALEINPRYAEAHNNLGSALLQLGKDEEAKGHFLDAVKISAANAEAYNNLGIIAVKEHDPKDAVAYFLKSVAAEPASAQTYYNLALSSLDSGNPRDAVKYATAATQLEPRNPNYHYILAAAYVQARSFPDAEKHFLQTLQLQPGFKAARHGLEKMRAEEKTVAQKN